MRAWVREFNEEGLAMDAEKFMPQEGPNRPFLPKRWIVERTLSWLSQNGRMSLGTTRGCRRARGVHLRGDEPPDGEEIGLLVRVFG